MSERSKPVRRTAPKKKMTVVKAEPKVEYAVDLDAFLQHMARIATGGLRADTFKGAVDIVTRTIKNNGVEITQAEASKLIQSKIQRTPHVVKRP